MAAPRVNIHCRQIGDCDLDKVADLLVIGFPNRTRAYWRLGLERQGRRSLPEGLPRYGYLLEAGGEPVGVVLALYMPTDGSGAYRCNLSSWYVDPALSRIRLAARAHGFEAERGYLSEYLSRAAHLVDG